MYNWYHFFTAIIQHVYGHKLQYILYIALPLYIPTSTYLAPSSCDRNGPPQSRLLVNCPLCPPLLPCTHLFPISHPFWVFPNPNVLLIRTHPNPLPSIRHIRYVDLYCIFSDKPLK
jgi:hypothetical protein